MAGQKIPGSPDEVRGLLPAVRESFEFIRMNVLEAGVVDPALKELCYKFLADETNATDAASTGSRERLVLELAQAIAFDANRADDALWARLHSEFTEAEIVDLSCAIGFELGQQHWRRSVGLPVRDKLA